MIALRLTRMGGTNVDIRTVLVNWDNVDFAIDTHTHYGDDYTEIHCGSNTVDVKETLKDIELMLSARKKK